MLETPLQSLFEILDDRLLKEVELALCRRVSDAVQAYQERDEDLADWDRQLLGRSAVLGQKPWKGSADLDDPITMEALMQLAALLMQAQEKFPKWQVEANEEEDKDEAENYEYFLTVKALETRLNDFIYKLAYNALRHPYAVLYMGWTERYRKERDTIYRHQETGEEVSDEERIEGEEYDAVPIVREKSLEFEGMEWRVPHAGDFYMYPPGAQDVQKCSMVCERILLSEDDLLLGVRDFGYDEHKVDELLRSGPTNSAIDGSWYERQEGESNGINDSGIDFRDGLYECFLCFGHLPVIRDAKNNNELPEHLDGDDFCMMVCPASGKVFKLDFSPYGNMRPYGLATILPDPNDINKSWCVTRGLESLQTELNGLLRFTLDCLSLKMTPAQYAKPAWIGKYGNKYTIYPGAIIPRESPDEVAPVVFGGEPEMGFQMVQYAESRAKGLVAAEGYGQQDSKVRKAAEIQNVLNATNSKFDFFLQNFQRSIMEEIAIAMVTRYTEHMGADDDGEFVFDGKKRKITKQEIRGRFRFLPVATAQTSTPEARAALAEKKKSLMLEFIGAVAQLPPPFHKQIWHGFRKLFQDLGEHAPETWIGPEPADAPPAMPGMPPNGGNSPPQQIQGMMNGNGNGHAPPALAGLNSQ